MNKQEKITKLQNDIAFWQDKLNRSRKESLRSIRALHLQRCQRELDRLTQDVELEEACAFFDERAKRLGNKRFPVSPDCRNFSFSSFR